MLFRRLEILSDRQIVAAGGQNIIHEDRDLLVCLSEADHESGLGQDRRILFLYIAQNAQRPLIARLRADGVRGVMLPGDRKSATDAVAEELGIAEVHSELLPEDKVTQVERLLGEGAPGKYLAFVGDGINDAPVLARADLGAAMGGIGSDAAIAAADKVESVVLLDMSYTKRCGAVATGNDHFLCWFPEKHGDISVVYNEFMDSQNATSNDTPLVMRFLETSPKIVNMWIAWGINMKPRGDWLFEGHAFPGRPRAFLK